MSRSIWAAAGACAVALATMPAVALAKDSGSSSSHVRGGKAPAAATRQSARRHPHHIENRLRSRRRRAATRAGHRAGYLLVPGTGYQQATGSRQVRSLQRRLTHLGFAPGPIDGRYGPLTATAVRRLQAAAGLAADGVAGPRTLAMVAGIRHGVLAPGAGYQRRGGSRRVRALQRRLARLGFAPGPIDGRYGPLTTRAIRRFQRTRHLAVSGVTGVRTLVALRTVRHHPSITRSAPAPLPKVSAPRSPVTGRPQPGTPLPVGLVLIALAALGVAAATHSYWSTRRRLRTVHVRSSGHPPGAGESRAQPAGGNDGPSGTGGAPPTQRGGLMNSRGATQ